MARADWLKIKNDYLTKNFNYEKLAAKYGISRSSIEKRASKEKWRDDKNATCKKIESKVQEKTIEKVAEKVSDRNARILEISDLATDAIEEYLKEKHYKKHVVKYKYYDCEGKPNKEELKAVELSVADTKAFSNMIASLDKIQKGQRVAEGADKPAKQNNSNQLDDLVKIMAMGGVKRQ
jgi:tRNA A37 N6-isopentenylltransferase MiaA